MPAKPYPRLDSLDFGRLSAIEERKRAPKLLLDGYFDYQQAAYRLATGEAWFIVGRKGSGKSAALEHIGLLWDKQPTNLLTEWDLGSFPISDVTTIKVGTQAGPSSTRAAWEFLILLRVFESLMRDNGAQYPADILRLAKELRSEGLIEGPDLRTRFFNWSSTTAKFEVFGFGAEGRGDDSAATALQLSEILRRAIRMISSNSRHLISLDGLDSFFAQSEMQFQSLGALVEAATSVNHLLDDTGLRFNVVMAVRSDLLSNVPATDSAKIGDRTITLDWSLTGNGTDNDLWKLVNKKALTSVPDRFEGQLFGDIRKAYLDSDFRFLRYDSIPEYFMDHTRLLPRDMVALLTALREVHPGAGKVTASEAKAAVRRYSELYFLTEISNNLSRILPGESGGKVSALLEAMAALDSPRFSSEQLEKDLEGELDRSDLRALLRQLHIVGALGVRGGNGSNKHTNFSYRRIVGGGFKFPGNYVLHNALLEAWNIRR